MGGSGRDEKCLLKGAMCRGRKGTASGKQCVFKEPQVVWLKRALRGRSVCVCVCGVVRDSKRWEDII